MWIIGLLLLAAAVAVGIDIAMMNDQQVDLEAFNQVWTSSPAAAFVVGVVTTLVGVAGLWLLVNGLRRSRVRTRSRRAEMAERDRLADERRRELDAMSASTASRHDTADDDRVVDDDDREAVDLREDREAEHAEHRGMLHRSEH
ncbi:MAG TPA: hypothetical protein VHI95_05010 [Acidimicrobiales bacterium]|jgi:hypothetical protein|nr:hypothetical protein [Acidimicrobiales bacterium]